MRGCPGARTPGEEEQETESGRSSSQPFPFFLSTHARLSLSLSLSFRREAALSSIKLVDADIAVVMEAADLGRPAAERALREAGGKLEGALDRLARP